MSTGRVPFTVIGGYLGSGKTTLLNHILRNNPGERIALLVNDFGTINIDAELIERQEGNTIGLADGCICCSLAAGFFVALETVLQQDPLPDRVIVEASGVADPGKIARYGESPSFALDGVIVVVDVETVQARAGDKYVGRTVTRQLASADLLVLNKIDLITPERKREVAAWLARVAPQSRLIEARFGSVPPAFLFGLDGDRTLSTLAANGDDHDHDAGYTTWTHVSPAPTTREAFEEYVRQLPHTVIRGKGFVYLAAQPDRQQIFQLVGPRWTLKPGALWQAEQRMTRIVFIAATP
ncbi:MAG: GTP-binding protein, partial [Caldilineaceae bacterium]|nr:GTP-binding protein [Caldilineaceae bacterium]